jgi:hypothetical protein
MARMDSSSRTGCQTCRASSAATVSPGSISPPRTLNSTGISGFFGGWAAKYPSSASPAGRSSGVWNGPEVRSIRQRDLPSRSAAHSTAVRCPPSTICPGQLYPAIAAMPAAEAARHAAATSASSAPSTAQRAKSAPSAAAAMALPRKFTARSTSASVNARAAYSAAYSPSDCPAAQAGATPRCASTSVTPAANAVMHGWVKRVASSWCFGSENAVSRKSKSSAAPSNTARNDGSRS